MTASFLSPVVAGFILKDKVNIKQANGCDTRFDFVLFCILS